MPDWEAILRRITALRGPDLMLVTTSVLYLVATFLPWYEATLGPLTISEGAWNAGGLGLIAALCGLASASVALSVALGIWRVGQQTVTLLEIVLAPATLLFTFLRLVIDPPGASLAQFTMGAVKIGRGFGLWAAFVLAIAMTVAAVAKYRRAAGGV